MIVSEQRQLRALCDRLTAMNAPNLPLFTAVAAKRIAVVSVLDQTCAWQTAEIERLTRPVVVVVGDDPTPGEGEALGPEGWACARRLRYWIRAAIIHGAAGEADHYRAAVEAAELIGRVALIETSAAMAPAWAAFLRCPRTLFILPKNGTHPVLPAMGARH